MHVVKFKQPKAKQKKKLLDRIKHFFKHPLESFYTHSVVFYDSAETLPYRRYHKFNKFFMIASEVGCSVGDYDKRMQRAISYVNTKDFKSAGKELTNQRQCVHHALEEYSPKGMALAVTVYSINGAVCDKYQDDDLNLILDKLDEIGFTKLMADTAIETVKKK